MPNQASTDKQFEIEWRCGVVVYNPRRFDRTEPPRADVGLAFWLDQAQVHDIFGDPTKETPFQVPSPTIDHFAVATADKTGVFVRRHAQA